MRETYYFFYFFFNCFIVIDSKQYKSILDIKYSLLFLLDMNSKTFSLHRLYDWWKKNEIICNIKQVTPSN